MKKPLAQPSLIDDIKKMGAGSFLDVRQLDDGTVVGLGKLLYTTAVYVDMDLWGWSKRYCYDDPQKAQEQYDGLRTGDDIPSGWIAQRPQQTA